LIASTVTPDSDDNPYLYATNQYGRTQASVSVTVQ